jgi:PAS domain S-box-containing protein
MACAPLLFPSLDAPSWHPSVGRRCRRPSRRPPVVNHPLQTWPSDEEIRQAYGLLAAITQGTADAIAAENHEFRYIFFNDAFRREFEQLWGRPPAIGMSMIEALAPWPEEQQKARDLWGRALAGETFSITMEFGPEDDKQVYDLRFNPVRDASGHIVGAAHIIRNTTEQARVQRALRTSAERYRLVNKATNDVIWDWDLRTNELLWNEALARAFGHDPATVPRAIEWWYEHLHPDDRERIVTGVHAAIDVGEEMWRDEYRFRRADGSYATVLDRGHVSRDDDGRPVRMIGSMLDLTSRLDAEASLRESEIKFRAFFEQAAVGMGRVRFSDARWIDVNDTFCRMLGYTREELVHKPWPEITHPDDVDLDMVPFRQMGAGRLDAYVVEKRFIHKDGHHVWARLTLSLVRTEHGSPDYEIAVIEDVTERKRAEEALRESEERFRNVADDAPVMVWMTNPDGVCTYLSQSWYVFTGQAPGQGLGFGWLDAVHPDDRPHSGEVFLAANQAHAPFRLDHRLRRHDGEYRWAIDSGKPRFDTNGEFLGYVGSVMDITERKQVEEALREADRRKDEFLAVLAHELRNPLGAIRMALAVLQESDGDATRVGGMTGIIDRQSAHLARLIDDLLDVSRITSGKVRLRTTGVDLCVVAAHVAEGVRSSCASQGLRLAVVLPPEPITIHADPVRLTQVIGNLLNNACKFTDRGGEVRLSVSREHDEAVIRVRDTGIGIPPDQRTRIFEMFTQVEGRGAGGGLGIGLALTRSIVELHGGAIEVHSAGTGSGSEFIVRLPANGANAAAQEGQVAPATETPEARAGRGGARRRILAVDDNRDALEAVALMLELGGHEVYTAEDGVRALEAAAAHKPEVAFLDIGMPGLDGYEVARRIRREPWGRTMRLVAMTGWGQEKDKQQAGDAGFDAHLTKPVDPDDLERMLADDGGN